MSKPKTMKHSFLGFLAIFSSYLVTAQYTDVINSNRPGVSVSAYAVGKNVVQAEMGLFYEKQEHTGLLTESNHFGTDFSLRYGLFLERLEVSWEGVFLAEKMSFNSTEPPVVIKRSNFSEHTINAKYLLYDRYKNLAEQEPNVYSWKANNSFKWSDLIPSVAILVGGNLNISDSPFVDETDPQISPRIGIATQNHFSPHWVFVTNILYEKITANDPRFSYVLTLTHALQNPKWSVFAEHQGIKSDVYADGIFRLGAAHLFGKNLQLDAAFGLNIKNTPSRLFGNIGLSYRLDYH